MKKSLLSLLCCLQFLFSACEKEDAASKMKLSFSDPQAILFNNVSKGGTSTNSTTATFSQAAEAGSLFQIDKQGNVTPVVEGVEISLVKPFSKGAVVYLATGEIFCLYLDNTSLQLPSDVDEFKGENENGDLIFAKGYIVRKAGQKIEKIQSTLPQTYVQYTSGNFAVINGGSVMQAFNTVSNERFNIGCNAFLLALNQEQGLVQECSAGTSILNMKTGSKSQAEIQSLLGESVYTGKGAVILSPEVASMAGFREQGAYGLGYVDTDGKLSLLSNEKFSPGSSRCVFCGEASSILFVSGDHYVIREIDKVSYVKKGDPAKKVILSGYNVTSVSLKNSTVYFLAEDKFGERVAGIYSLLDGTTHMLETQEEFDQVFTLK